MKSLETVLSQIPVFLHSWEHRDDVIADFENVNLTHNEYIAVKSPYTNSKYWLEEKRKLDYALNEHEGENILFASYGQDNWSGDAFVLFEKNGGLYEVNGSHCSCYGLEGQWEPEETTLDALMFRLTKGEFGKDDYSGNEFHQELCDFLGI